MPSNKLTIDKTQQTFVVLQNVERKLNRYRAYSLSVLPVQVQPRHYIYKVTQSWGRIGGKMRTKVSFFDEFSESEKYVTALYKKRLAHDYLMVSHSGYNEAEQQKQLPMPYYTVDPRQLNLFAAAI